MRCNQAEREAIERAELEKAIAIAQPLNPQAIAAAKRALAEERGAS